MASGTVCLPQLAHIVSLRTLSWVVSRSQGAVVRSIRTLAYFSIGHCTVVIQHIVRNYYDGNMSWRLHGQARANRGGGTRPHGSGTCECCETVSLGECCETSSLYGRCETGSLYEHCETATLPASRVRIARQCLSGPGTWRRAPGSGLPAREETARSSAMLNTISVSGTPSDACQPSSDDTRPRGCTVMCTAPAVTPALPGTADSNTATSTVPSSSAGRRMMRWTGLRDDAT